jgi:hypothetical protein
LTDILRKLLTVRNSHDAAVVATEQLPLQSFVRS